MTANDGISVIIVSYNHRHVIGECLAPLGQAPDTVETIVVDNASSDGTATFIRDNFPFVNLTESSENKGFGAGCNEGFRCSRMNTLLFLNPDASAEPAEIEKLVTFLHSKPKAAAAGPKIFRGQDVEFSCRPFPGYKQALFHRYSVLTRLFPNNRFSRDYLLSDWDHDSPRTVDWISGSAMAIRREAFEQIKGFDEAYFLFCEDTDLCKRFWDNGWEVWFTPDARVHHRIGESEQAGSIQSLLQRHKSIWLYYRKFHGGSVLKDAITFLGVSGRFILYSLGLLIRKARA